MGGISEVNESPSWISHPNEKDLEKILGEIGTYVVHCSF